MIYNDDEMQPAGDQPAAAPSEGEAPAKGGDEAAA